MSAKSSSTALQVHSRMLVMHTRAVTLTLKMAKTTTWLSWTLTQVVASPSWHL